MVGTKERVLAMLPSVTLGDLVPADHLYRHLERMLDLTFVCDLVQDYYAGGWRPSIGPVVFFKLHLIMFFEDLRSEPQLMRIIPDQPSLRIYSLAGACRLCIDARTKRPWSIGGSTFSAGFGMAHQTPGRKPAGSELEWSAGSEGGRDGVDQRRGCIVNDGHAGTEGGEVIDAVRDVVS